MVPHNLLAIACYVYIYTIKTIAIHNEYDVIDITCLVVLCASLSVLAFFSIQYVLKKVDIG